VGEKEGNSSLKDPGVDGKIIWKPILKICLESEEWIHLLKNIGQ
jgi:hypothetical protein